MSTVLVYDVLRLMMYAGKDSEHKRIESLWIRSLPNFFVFPDNTLGYPNGMRWRAPVSLIVWAKPMGVLRGGSDPSGSGA